MISVSASYGTRTRLPVVLPRSMSVCSRATSASGYVVTCVAASCFAAIREDAAHGFVQELDAVEQVAEVEGRDGLMSLVMSSGFKRGLRT